MTGSSLDAGAAGVRRRSIAARPDRRAGRGVRRRVGPHDHRCKAYDGEVEAFTSAESFGRRRPGRSSTTGRASRRRHARRAVVVETLAEARDNVAFGEHDECFGLAEPDGVEAVPTSTCGAPALASFATEDKIDAGARARAARARRRPAHHRRAHGDLRRLGGRGARSPRSTGIAVLVGRDVLLARRSARSPRDGDETQIGGGVDVGPRAGRALDLDEAAGRRRRAGDPAARRHEAAVAAAHDRARAAAGGDAARHRRRHAHRRARR